MIEIKNLYKSFNGEEVLSNFSLDIYNKDIIAIMGKSGTGDNAIMMTVQ